ncbi:MAG: hypothetical protein MK080_00820 [Opitutales bacterium]|nr:hypothetical protein [Opitutales bacterium]NRA26227.1 hypothetical protein [Opitutales bacterium]
MRIIFPIFCSLSFLLLCACSDSQLGESAARERLRNDYLKAVAQQDFEAMVELYHWEHVEPRYRQLVLVALRNELPMEVRDITFHDLEPGDGIDFEFQGEPYTGNLTPQLRMGVEFETEDFFSTSYLLGFHVGRYKIINAVPRKSLKTNDSDNATGHSHD